MATYVAYVPTTTIARAMFNFDAFGSPNYKLTGTVRVSVSDAFDYGDYIDPGYSNFSSGLFTSILTSNEVAWTAQMLANIEDVLAIYSSFANISFQVAGDFDFGLDSTPNPEDLGRANVSDINFTWIYRSDVGFAGVSGGYSDSILGYTGAAGDVFLNAYAPKFAADYSLDVNTRARQTLMHEIGHSLGLSHPHSSYSLVFGPTITADYASTKDLGFDQLGFRTNSAADMHKEYFTIMSYDDQHSLLPNSTTLFHAHTPMILDVIALQTAYGEGLGTHGAGNDTIVAGTAGYRTYFDIGGEDTIDLSMYSLFGGAYLHMGVSIVGAPHLVGVGMSLYDAQNTIVLAGDPAHLRWFYGEYENAVGSSAGDLIIGNSLDNVLQGQAGGDVIADLGGNDVILGGTGDDQLQGGPGNDTYQFGLGHGQDTVYDFDATPGNQDTLTFEAGILPADIGVYRSGSDLVLARRGTYDQDRVTLQQFDLGADYQIEQFTFTGDATVWTPAYLLSHVEQGGAVLARNNGVHSGLPTAAGGLFQVTDPDGGSPYSYELWDGGAGGGYFRVGGVQQAAGTTIPVSAAQFATTDYFGGAAIGSETVYVRVYDGLLWTGWASWTMYTHNRPTNNAPVVTAPARNIDQNQWRQLSELITVADADGDALNQYQITDSTGGPGSAYLYANGAVQGQGATVLVSAVDLANTWVNGGANLGANGFAISAFDGFGWSTAATLDLTTRGTPNRAPVVAAPNGALQVGQVVAANTLWGFSDADGDAPFSFELYDAGAGGGHFQIGAQAQAALTVLPVTAMQLASTQYVAGASPGVETLWVRGYDGQAWSAWTSWQQFSQPAGANALPVVTAPARNIDQNQWRQLSELITVADADGDALNQYQITDSTGGPGSAYLYANGAVQGQGATVLVSAVDLANTWVNGGANLGANGFAISAFDGFGWSTAATLDLTTRGTPNRAPVVAAPNGALQVGQVVAANTLWGFSDADGDAPFSFELYDAGAGGGHFQIGAQAQAALTVLPVTAMQLASTQYVAGASPGVETLWVRGYDGQAWSAWTSWQQFSQPAGANALPVVTAPARNIDQNQWRQLSELITVADADGDALNQYQITDSTGGPGSAYLYANGAVQGQGATVLVSAVDLANTWVNGGANLGANGFAISAFDGFGWSTAATLDLTTRGTPNRAPVVAAPNGALQVGQVVAANTLWGFSDADGDAPFSFELYDAGAGGGHFQIGAQAQAALTVLPVTAMQLASTQYVAGASPGVETLWVRGYDGQAWSAWTSWQQFSQPAGANALPVVTAPARNIDQNQWRQLSELITVADADGDALNQYQITDSTGGPGSAYLYANGAVQGQGATVLVSAVDLANTWVNGGANLGANGFAISAFDGFGWSTAATLDLTTRGTPNRAPVVAAPNGALQVGQVVAANTLWGFSDADGDAPFSFELYDAGAGGGHFQIGAQAQAALTVLPVTAMQLASTQYVAGASPGVETLWVRGYDGQAWSGWSSWSMATLS